MSHLKTSFFKVLGTILVMTTPALGQDQQQKPQTQTLVQGNVLSGINLRNINRRLDGRPFWPDFPFDEIGLDNFLEVDETFLVAEPEVNVTLNVTETFRIGFGGGYRFIGAADGFEDRLNGFSANLAAQFRF